MLSSPLMKFSEKIALPVAVSAAVCGRVPTGTKDPLWLWLGSRVSALRTRCDLPATRLSAMAGLALSAISQIEDAKMCPQASTVEKIAVCLGVSPSWIAFGYEGFEPFQQRRPRDVVPLDPPAPEPGERTPTDRYRGIGVRCLRLRQARGLSLRPVAKAAGVSHESLNKIEKGVNVPLVSTCERLAVALDCAPSWLTYGEGAQPEGLDDSATAAD